jgi:hypothetical protein
MYKNTQIIYFLTILLVFVGEVTPIFYNLSASFVREKTILLKKKKLLLRMKEVEME